MASITGIEIQRLQEKVCIRAEVEYGADEPSRKFGVSATLVGTNNRKWQLPLSAIQNTPDRIVVPSDVLVFDFAIDQNQIEEEVGADFQCKALLLEQLQDFEA